MGDLTRNFSKSEFECKCGCGKADINIDFVNQLQRIRDVFGPMQITSGYRCDKHNESVGGSKNSDHKRGLGVDIAISDGVAAFRMVDIAISEGVCKIGIKRKSGGHGFIHLGGSKGTPVIWTY